LVAVQLDEDDIPRVKAMAKDVFGMARAGDLLDGIGSLDELHGHQRGIWRRESHAHLLLGRGFGCDESLKFVLVSGGFCHGGEVKEILVQWLLRVGVPCLNGYLSRVRKKKKKAFT
jgi:hypothetical protein